MMCRCCLTGRLVLITKLSANQNNATQTKRWGQNNCMHVNTMQRWGQNMHEQNTWKHEDRYAQACNVMAAWSMRLGFIPCVLKRQAIEFNDSVVAALDKAPHSISWDISWVSSESSVEEDHNFDMNAGLEYEHLCDSCQSHSDICSGHCYERCNLAGHRKYSRIGMSTHVYMMTTWNLW